MKALVIVLPQQSQRIRDLFERGADGERRSFSFVIEKLLVIAPEATETETGRREW